MFHKISGTITAIFLLLSTAAFTDSAFTTYKNEAYNYQINLPSSWHNSELNLENKHVLYCAAGTHVKIKVKALKTDEQDLDRIAQTNAWNIRNIDPRLNEIIETGKITIKKNIFGKLLVCEYRSRNNTYLQRTLITINKGIIYVIECMAPVQSFYRYESLFNGSLASFIYLSGDGGEKS